MLPLHIFTFPASLPCCTLDEAAWMKVELVGRPRATGSEGQQVDTIRVKNDKKES